MKIFKSSELSEKLKIRPVNVNKLDAHTYTYFPKTKQELCVIIRDRIEKEGNYCDLNDINVTEIKDFSFIFSGYEKFNGNVSLWDVSNGYNFDYMFSDCYAFNCPLDSWNMEKAIFLNSMFYNCHAFNQNLNSWDVSNVEYMNYMFKNCYEFNGNISSWDVSNVKTMKQMFSNCKNFMQNISSWNVADACSTYAVFELSPLSTEQYRSHLPKNLQ